MFTGQLMLVIYRSRRQVTFGTDLLVPVCDRVVIYKLLGESERL